MSFSLWPWLALAFPKNPDPDLAGAGSDREECFRNPRTFGRSGCAPAEPYPPKRAKTNTRNNLKTNSRKY
jgi:hypothetical protein